jgi:hypothetical protein
MRKGTLSDQQTLDAYQKGTSVIALCLHEGMTVHGVLGRLSRARRSWRDDHPRRVLAKKAPSEIVASLREVRDAMKALERLYG